jgi:hypothetical protein
MGRIDSHKYIYIGARTRTSEAGTLIPNYPHSYFLDPRNRVRDMRKCGRRVDTSGILSKWAIQLGTYDEQTHTRKKNGTSRSQCGERCEKMH